MPATPWIPVTKTVKDGTDVSAAVVNPIFSQHTQRAQHLKELFEELLNKSTLIAYSQPILAGSVGDVKKNSVVFGDFASEAYGLSLAKTEFAQSSKNTTAYTPANSSYAFGIVSTVNNSNNTADVFMSGLVEFESDINEDTVDDPSILQSDERVEPEDEFLPGPLFLSRTEAGKLTRNPGGVAIFVGYALTRTKILLSPDVSEFNQFFTAFRYNLLDRPAGRPYYNSGTGFWEILGTVGDNLEHIGWIPVTEAYLGTEIWENHVPSDADGNKPAFFYNLPSSTLIDEDTGVDEAEREQQKDLSATLPPNPVTFTFLTVNGVVQANTDMDSYGVYTVNSVGIWWWNKTDGSQPWASDTTSAIAVTFSGTEVTFAADHGAELNDKLRFMTTGSLPTGMSTSTDYYVQAIVSDTVLKIATTVDASSAISFSGGSGTHSVPQPYIWKASHGSEVYRPKMLLQFLKFNPSLGESIVTSIKKFNPNSSAIRFYKADKVTEATKGTGDLLARLMLTYTAGTALESASSAITSVTYNEATGVTETRSAPVVSKIIGSSGITVNEVTVGGAVKPGQFIISNNNNVQSGRVSYVEPDGAELVYAGLHSYLEMPYTTVLPSSFIGKIVLPSDVPAADLKLVFVAIGLSNLASNATSRNVSFDFSYSVSKPGAVLGAAGTPTPITFQIPLDSGYTAKTCFKIGAGLTASTYSIVIPELIIPASDFTGGDCAVNFKLARTTPGSNPYTNPVGIVDMYWRIG